MMELADVLDSKSSGSDTVRVRPPLPAPKKRRTLRCASFLQKVQIGLQTGAFCDILTASGAPPYVLPEYGHTMGGGDPMKSSFAATCEMPHFEPLGTDTKTDVLVIGGGITGILTATLLKRAGVDTVLVEAEQLCSGQTGNTTAKITAEPGFAYAPLLARYGIERARGFYEAQMAALQEYRILAREIPCDFEEKDFYAYATTGNERALGDELAALERIGVRMRFANDLRLPFDTVGAVCFPQQAQFHPLRLLAALARELCIYEKTPVCALDSTGAQTVTGCRIRAAYVVVATHFPFLRFRGGFPFKMYQSRSYVVALKNATLPDGMYADGAGKGPSLRELEGYLLLGGAGHRTGVRGGGYDALLSLAGTYYPNSRVVDRFAAQDCMTLDGIPYIGQYTKHTPRLLVATGFGKWGMASAMVAAMLLRDRVLAQSNPYATIFDPARPWPLGTFAAHAGAVLLHYLRPTTPRCPHLGCALRWNEQERSWDCPCHGSRFAQTGELLDAPATKDLASKKAKLYRK